MSIEEKHNSSGVRERYEAKKEKNSVHFCVRNYGGADENRTRVSTVTVWKDDHYPIAPVIAFNRNRNNRHYFRTRQCNKSSLFDMFELSG